MSGSCERAGVLICMLAFSYFMTDHLVRIGTFDNSLSMADSLIRFISGGQ